jgi:signal transduction histidine kinase
MLRKKFRSGLAPFLLIVIVIGIGGIVVARYLAGTFQHELLSGLQTVTRTQVMRDSVQSIESALQLAQSGHLLEADRAFSKAHDTVSGLLLEESTQGFTDKNVKSDFQALDDAFHNLSERGSLIKQGGLSGSMNALRDNESSVYKTYAALDRYSRAQFEHAEVVSHRVKQLASTTTYILSLMIGGAVITWLLIARKLTASFLLPIEALTYSATALGKGDWDKSIPETTEDELGLLGKAFNTMAEQLREYKKAMTVRVQVAQRTMEATLKATPDPLFIVDKEGLESVRNPSAIALLDYAGLKEGMPEELKVLLSGVLKTGTHYIPAGYEHVLTFKSKSGDRYYLPRILAIGDQMTGFSGAAIFLQDVTQFRLIDDAKTNLVGMVSHELKTPLTSLRMAVYLLLENNGGQLSSKQRELLELTRDDSERLLRILNDLLNLSRLESGIAKLKLTSTPVEKLLKLYADEMKSITDFRSQKITVQVSDPTLHITVDLERIRHVFINLLSNASKYSHEDSEIILYGHKANAGFIKCGVKDKGPGISATDQAHIFEKFYRVQGQEHEGAGLGLAIAREIVIEHGGTIGCTSEISAGADFYVLLPS